MCTLKYTLHTHSFAATNLLNLRRSVYFSITYFTSMKNVAESLIYGRIYLNFEFACILLCVVRLRHVVAKFRLSSKFIDIHFWYYFQNRMHLSMIMTMSLCLRVCYFKNRKCWSNNNRIHKLTRARVQTKNWEWCLCSLEINLSICKIVESNRWNDEMCCYHVKANEQVLCSSIFWLQADVGKCCVSKYGIHKTLPWNWRIVGAIQLQFHDLHVCLIELEEITATDSMISVSVDTHLIKSNLFFHYFH